MVKLFTKFSICFLLAFVLSTNVYSKDNSKISVTNTLQVQNLSMYSASLEATAQNGGGGGILGDKKIRIINLGPVINHSGVDYAPTISADGKTLFYVSNKPGSILKESDDASHDFWVAKKENRLDTVFQKPFNLDPSNALGVAGVNTVLNEGAASLAADRQSLYFTACNRPDGLGSCDIYKTTIDGDKWAKPVNLGKNVNSKNFDSQPSISPDQSRLYFISTRKGPNSDGREDIKNFDIWYSDYDEDTDDWKPAQNLTAVNTPSRDVSPFIAADNVTLFFASDGHTPNFGGTDFYVTRYDPSAKSWSTPQNMGEPLNTSEDEQFISLPASGDIIYFSSKRTDLPRYSGDLDVFMAFVPSFFKAVNLTGTVVDECSGDFIPSTIVIKNPITNKITTDSLSMLKTSFERIVTNDDYGDPKDSVKYINFEITASNPKYGKKTVIQRVEKPKITNNEEEAGKIEDEINVKIPLGQRPILSADVETARYVEQNKDKIPGLSKFRGLVMEEVLSWDLYPLLSYVFFEMGKSDIPDRYLAFGNNSEAVSSSFTDTTIQGGTLDKYYHVLNIYGYRLTKFKDAKVTITGTNDNVTPDEKGNTELSKKRAQVVYDYLKNVWNIDESRMTLKFQNFPDTKSNPKDSLGWQENRRVEMYCSEWEVAKPVFEKDPKIFPQPETMNFLLNNGIEDGLIAKRTVQIMKGGQPWKTITTDDITGTTMNWNWKSEMSKYPKDEQNFTAKLIISTKSGAECISEPIDIPVMQVTSEKKKIEQGADTLYENYSLILFPFNSFAAGPLNEKIMNDYVYNRCQPTSVISITGHTDVIGLFETNKKLSINRAKTVNTGIQGKTKGKYGSLTSDGVGEDSALYTNDLPEGRFYNRTVQVLIKTPTSAYDK